MTRAERERKAFDEDNVAEYSHRWHARFLHVFESPNTMRYERLYEELLRAAVPGKRVLEIGCGDGTTASRLLSFGAAYVYGVDVSERYLARAREKEIPGRLEFANHDAATGFDRRFDVIVGRAVLHHLDYRDVVRRLHADTLCPGGRMIFMEPLGSNPLIRLFTLAVPKAHTPDERSFRREDLRWFREEFPGFEMYPYNYVSLPAGILSSLLFSRPDNALMRAADAVDIRLSKHFPWLGPQFRYAILVLRKNHPRP
jgi:SAM-dependent methyltransferase